MRCAQVCEGSKLFFCPSQSPSMSMEAEKMFVFQDESTDKGIKILIPEIVNPQFGLFTWPCAPVLAQFILRNKTKVAGKKILEIGAGTALPGIVACKCGGSVILSDAGHFKNCLANARKSCAINGLDEAHISVVSLTWGVFSSELFQLPRIDIILGSDCFYSPKDFEKIIFTAAYLMEKNPDCVFWSTYQLRSCSWSIEYLLEKWDLQCSIIPLSTFGGDADNLGGQSMSGKHTIQLLEIKRKT